MVCLSKPYHFRFFKGSLPQIFLGPHFEYLGPYFGLIFFLFLQHFEMTYQVCEDFWEAFRNIL